MFSATTKEYANATKESAKDDVREKVSKTRNAAYDAADQAESTVADVAETAGRRVRDFIDGAADKLQTTTDKVGDEVRENPVQSTMIALGVGFVLGMLFRGK